MNSAILTTFALVGIAVAADFRVTVGISQVTGQVGTGFDPNRIVPSAGDTITFSWLIPSYIQNPPTGTYSVTQSSADSPCQPLAGGFDSGARTTGPESAGQAPTLTFEVKDSNPLYFYSSVDDQCKKGMALGVNSPATGPGSIESYITAAGGNPNADTTTNSTTTKPTPSTNNSTTNGTRTTTSNNTSSTTKQPTTHSGSTSSNSAKPQNGSGVHNTPRVTLAVLSLLMTMLFL